MNEKITYHPYHETMVQTYDVLEYIPGHIPLIGREAYTMKNPIWRVREDGEEVLLMLCHPDNQICKLCPESYQILKDYEQTNKKKLTWCIFKNGYVHNSGISLYIHQLITECHGNGKGTGTISVDHINRNRLDNRKINLRVVGQKEQSGSSTHPYHETMLKTDDVMEEQSGSSSHSYHEAMLQTYDVMEYIPGHIPQNGCGANTMKNPIWRVREDGGEVFLMLCRPNNQICKLCPESYQIIKDYEQLHQIKLTWCICKNGYACNSVFDLYIHQIITGCHGNGKGTGTISVDHINRNRLDNRMINLRIVGQKEQIANATGVLIGTKRKRQVNAKQLPEGITQNMLRKNVIYLCEVYDKKSGNTREFFRVENHPNAQKDYASSKSKDVSIFDKLREANKIAEDLDNGILPEAKIRKIPFGFSLSKDNQNLTFERRIDGTRYSLKMKLPIDYNLEEEIEKLTDKVKVKYPEQMLFA